ncbi:MAG: ATP-dependent DNA helicase RecG [bacterium]|nr:ATP-dependent DNA helicase RecG [bacterium]
MLHLLNPLSRIPGIGPSYLTRLQSLGLFTVSDLLFYFPFRYDDFSTIANTSSIQSNTNVTIVAKLLSIENIFTRNGKKLTKALFQDDNGLIPVMWFNQPYLTKSLKTDSFYRLTGKVQEFSRIDTLISPKWERVIDKPANAVETSPVPTTSVHAGRLVPVYSETAGINSRWLREKVAYIIENLGEFPEEYLPLELLLKNSLYTLDNAISKMHFPENITEADKAKHRFAYEEILFAQLRSQLQRVQWRSKKLEYTLSISSYRPKIESVRDRLPFSLTTAQQRVVDEILHDLERSEPMNRLVEGDVGSGKTVVAALAMYAVHMNGYKSIIMAPTQILASQHFETISRILGPFGLRVVLITGGKKIKDEGMREEFENADIVVGTHALLHGKIILEKVALTIVDEQHRFGVAQRAFLRSRHGMTHILSMTATPIPRTLALTLYGDLDLSVIDEMPVGRKPIKTWVVPVQKREGAYNWIREHVRKTVEQVFVVCPFIEPSESSDTVKAAVDEFERLRTLVFPDMKVGLLHGGMKGGEKDTILQSFREKQIEILVCTPVVEVGIDIPNASIIIIESAERFGLAQLHQLRGRVGRGGQQAFCLLFTSTERQEDSRRLKALENSNSGLELAEIDLKYRGAGNIFGIQQSGKVLFKYADFFDTQFISSVKKDAVELLESDSGLLKHPDLLKKALTDQEKVEAN